MARTKRGPRERLRKIQKAVFYTVGADKAIKARNAALVADNARTEAPRRSDIRCTADPDNFAIVTQGYQAVRRLDSQRYMKPVQSTRKQAGRFVERPSPIETELATINELHVGYQIAAKETREKQNNS